MTYGSLNKVMDSRLWTRPGLRGLLVDCDVCWTALPPFVCAPGLSEEADVLTELAYK